MGRLSGKTVLVTGAAGGVGSAVCRAIERAGGAPIATDLSRRDKVDHALDVTVEADWLRVVAEIERMVGHLDGLVNAAGIAAVGSVESADFAQWRSVLSVNLDGAFLGCKHAFPLLRRRGGVIVNLSSVYGRVGNPKSSGLCSIEGRAAATDQIGRAPRREPQPPGALQQRVAGLP